MQKINKGFTLVELIVVITILAVIWTIAFISFSNYTDESKDVKVLTDMKIIEKWLELYSLKESWVFPKPDDSVAITLSWQVIWYQWYIWDDVSKNINIFNTPSQPNGKKYIYATNNNNTKFQLLWFLESNILFSMLPEVYADFDKTIITMWTALWVVLDSDSNLIEWDENWEFDILNNSWFNIKLNNTSNWLVQVDDVWLKVNSQFPWCPEKDIAIPTWNWTKIISSCNVWATSTDINSQNSWWYTYHWWNNHGFSLLESVNRSLYDDFYEADLSSYGPWNPFVRDIYVRTSNNMWLDTHPHSWFHPANWLPNNLWWASSENIADKRWVCPEWYYIPTWRDWFDVMSSSFFKIENSWIRWKENQETFSQILKLPHVKWRSHNSSVSSRLRWYYHTSDPLVWRGWREWDLESGYWWQPRRLWFTHNKDTEVSWLWRNFVAYSASVRCFKLND